ncbi:MAG: hypothetical protein JWL85_873 [Candidatus Saccharibacteria bacterium]|nr:hypothetical protein [Candidatus Saccharibacteria bacterium]
MPLAKKTRSLSIEESAEIEATLRLMTQDIKYNTESSYSANGELYPDNSISFVDKHLNYITKHPSIDPQHYLSNLRLMTRLR